MVFAWGINYPKNSLQQNGSYYSSFYHEINFRWRDWWRSEDLNYTGTMKIEVEIEVR